MGSPLPSLDLSTSLLRCGDGRTVLRPKDFAVLQHLIAQPGRLVSKDALIQAAWPGVFVTDAVLKACISRLRAALGDDAAAPRFIQTIPRRGYRLVGAIAVTESRTPDQWRPAGGVPPLDTVRCVVGRGEPLARLDGVLREAASGARQVVFVTGEAGVGKTALVDLFLDAHASNRALIGRGQCIERYGTGEAYMPILDALASVCRGSHGQMAIAALVRHAPGWLVQMPGVLATAESPGVLERAADVTRARMLRDLLDALEAIAAETPTVLVLEDLHWSDASTLDAIAAIARRRTPARLLLLCTYRPEDLSPGEHALVMVARELRLQRLALDVRLTSLDETAVAAYLAARFPGAAVPAHVARGIHRRTEGHPLFLVALADDWVANGWLVSSNGQWRIAVPAENLDRHVPDGMRQIVDARLDRLRDDDRRLIEAASVAGTTFSATSVAAALDSHVAPVDDRCAALARRGFLLCADGSETWPDGTTAGRYRFTHALYQEMTYEQVSAARRRHLHGRISHRERAGYGAHAGRIAARLAMHFEMGGDLESAVGLHATAAMNALAVGGYQEAVVHAAVGLSALARVPAPPDATARELTLQLLRGAAVSASRGFAAQEAERAYARAHELSRSLANPADALPALAGLYAFHLMRGPAASTREVGEEMLVQSRRAGHGPGEVWASMAVGVARLQVGDLAAACALFEDVIARYPSHEREAYARIHTVDPLLAAFGYASWTLWLMGQADRALEHGRQASALAEARRQPVDRAHSLVLQAHLHQMRREPTHAAECAAEALRVSAEFGIEQYLWPATIVHGWALAVSAGTVAGLAELERGMAEWGRIGAQYAQPRHYALLAEARACAGDVTGAREALRTATAIVSTTGERFWEPEFHRMEGDLHLQAAEVTPSSRQARDVNCARGCFEAAVHLARGQGSAMLELRALTSLCRLERLLGRSRAAERQLRRLCTSLTEGRNTPDLADARALAQG